MSSVSFVALLAEREVVAAQTVKSKHLLWNRVHATITAEPSLVAFLHQLLLSSFHCFNFCSFANLILEVLLEFFLRFQVVMVVRLDLIALVLEKLQVNAFIGFNVELLILNIRVLIVLVIKHLSHSLIIDIRNELSF